MAISAKPRRRGKRAGSRKHGPTARARRSSRGKRHHNFHSMGGGSKKFFGLDPVTIGVGGVGAVGSGLLANIVADKVPFAGVKSGAGKIALRAGVSVAVAMLAHKFVPKKFSQPLIVGSFVGLGIDVLQTYVMPHLTHIVGLSGYETLEQNLGMIEAASPGSLAGLVAIDQGVSGGFAGVGAPGMGY